MQERLEIFGATKSVIDSSQVVGGLAILRYFRKVNAKKDRIK